MPSRKRTRREPSFRDRMIRAQLARAFRQKQWERWREAMRQSGALSPWPRETWDVLRAAGDAEDLEPS